jgi:hypothetical protein
VGCALDGLPANCPGAVRLSPSCTAGPRAAFETRLAGRTRS